MLIVFPMYYYYGYVLLSYSYFLVILLIYFEFISALSHITKTYLFKIDLYSHHLKCCAICIHQFCRKSSVVLENSSHYCYFKSHI